MCAFDLKYKKGFGLTGALIPGWKKLKAAEKVEFCKFGMKENSF